MIGKLGRLIFGILWVILGILAAKMVFYRFQHPGKTETQLFIDMITLEIFK
jgi:hypothetical protein